MRQEILVRAATTLWLILCFAVLALSLGGGDHPRPGEADIVLVVGMAVLGFPTTAGLALTEAETMRRLYECCAITYPRGDLVRIVRWAVYLGVAALQWYVLVPMIMRRVKPKAGAAVTK